MQPLTITFCFRPVPTIAGARHAVVRVLEEAGHCVRQVSDGRIDLGAADVVWLEGNANWYPAIRKHLLATPEAERPLVLIWHSEPLPPPRAAGLPRPRLHLREIGKLLLRDPRATDVCSNAYRLRQLARHGLPDILITSTAGRQEFLQEQGISASMVPLGYSSEYGGDLKLRRDIDVLFLGAPDVPRRRRLLRRLRRAGVDVLARGSWYDPSTWGDRRTTLLNRTKILLNFARYPGELSGVRLILGMANKALVISEPIYRPEPYVPGLHYVSAAVEDMPRVIRHYLADEQERQRIVAAGYQLVTEEVTLRRSVTCILDLVRTHLGSSRLRCTTDTIQCDQQWHTPATGTAET